MIYQPKPRLGIQLNKKHKLAKGLVGCWLMNEQSGNLVQDLSGEGNHGTNNGATWVPEGLSFNGTSDYIAFSYDKLNLSYPFSIATAATYYTNYQNSYVLTISTNYLSSNSFFVGINPSHEGFCSTYGTAGFKSATSIDTVSTGDRFSATGIFSSDSKREVWLNGDSYGINTTTTNINFDILDRVSLCKLDRNADSYYIGKKFEYAYIYNRILSPSEIKQLNINPYQIFQKHIDPALSYYETPSGLTILDFERSVRGMNRGMNRGIA